MKSSLLINIIFTHGFHVQIVVGPHAEVGAGDEILICSCLVVYTIGNFLLRRV